MRNDASRPTATTVGLLRSKWKIAILHELFSGAKRFGELKRSQKGISQKVLASSLKSLEKDGLIVRQVQAQSPLHVEYSLSELGQSLEPVLQIMREWGELYLRRG
jgi:DNA-binding HxlR family transcriptional regulator